MHDWLAWKRALSPATIAALSSGGDELLVEQRERGARIRAERGLPQSEAAFDELVAQQHAPAVRRAA